MHDSPLEGSGFEPSVPRDTTKVFKTESYRHRLNPATKRQHKREPTAQKCWDLPHTDGSNPACSSSESVAMFVPSNRCDGVAHGRNDRPCGANEGAGHFRHQRSRASAHGGGLARFGAEPTVSSERQQPGLEAMWQTRRQRGATAISSKGPRSRASHHTWMNDWSSK